MFFLLHLVAGSEGGLPPERRLGLSKICVVLLELAGIEGVGALGVGGCIAGFQVFLRGAMIRRPSFFQGVFDCVWKVFMASWCVL